MRRLTVLFTFILASAFVAGCASSTVYKKPDAPWATIKRVGVFPLETPFEDKVRRQWATQLLLTELRRLDLFEVVELNPPGPSAKAPDLSAIARQAEVDAFMQGIVEDMSEIFADLKMVDAATGEILWSARYHRGGGQELSLRYHTPQQQLQRIFRILLRQLSRTAAHPQKSKKIFWIF